MWSVALWWAACADEPEPTTPVDTTPAWTLPGAGVITLETRDGVTLEADYYPAENAGAPGIVLLHMIPPSNDRTGWPTSFIGKLSARGWAVIAVDRRGAGGSGGEAIDAYEGPKGRNDVEACALKLRDDGYGALGVIGASNGTTSMSDYTQWAAGEGDPVPVALGFMTGGTYTENNNPMTGLTNVEAVFTYSTAERDWSEAQRPVDADWQFLEYANGDHGTRMFAAEPSVEDDLVAFFVDKLPAR